MFFVLTSVNKFLGNLIVRFRKRQPSIDEKKIVCSQMQHGLKNA